MQKHQKRVRVSLAISVGLHMLVFGGLAFWIVPKTFISRHSTPVAQINSAEETTPKAAPEPKPVVVPIPPPVTTKEPSETKPIVEAIVDKVVIAPQMEMTNEIEVPAIMSEGVASNKASFLPKNRDEQKLFLFNMDAGDKKESSASTFLSNLPDVQRALKLSVPAVVQQARYRRNPPPVYPASARRLRQEGIVLLAVQVNEKGRPTETKIKTSSGFSLLDTAAQKAVLRWEFVPAQSTNGTVASEVEVPVQFKLDAR